MSARTAYDTIAREALREALANAPVSTLATIAARGARIDAMRAGLDPASATVRGEVLSAACDAAAHFAHGKDGAAATAARITRILREETESVVDGKTVTHAKPAVRYAMDSSVTGSLVALKMRVRPGQRSHDVDRPRVSTDGGAERIRAARGVACADLTRAFACRVAASGAARKALTSQIRAIVRIWHDDPAVAEICRANGWSINDR